MLDHVEQASLEVVVHAGIGSFGGGGIEQGRHAAAQEPGPPLEDVDDRLHGKDDGGPLGILHLSRLQELQEGA